MFVERMVTNCDFTDKSYQRPVKGAAAVAQGATGRWCEVMWMGPEYLEKNNITPLDYNEAVAKCMEYGGEIDF